MVFLKAEETTSWLKDIHSQVLQQALHDLKAAFDHFFRRVRNKEIPGYPQFRRKGENDSFRYPQGVRVEKGYSRFSPKFYIWSHAKAPRLSDHKQVNVKGDTCTIVLGDGTKRLYQKASRPPTIPFSNLHAELGSKVIQLSYYRLISETLPSGNTFLFSYNADGQLDRVEIQNSSEKVHSWIQFNLKNNMLTLETSDQRTIHYKFDNSFLKEVTGTHCIPCSYDYQNGSLIRKRFPEGRFVEIEYDDMGRVSALKKPHPDSGKPFIAKEFQYGTGYTDIHNAAHVKTRYHYDEKLQLIALDYFDENHSLYRRDRKYYGAAKEATYLLARTIADGTGKSFSYRTFKYDESGNILEEKLYGTSLAKKTLILL